MRIVTLGFPMPSARVDNHSIANAPSLFEYDACLMDARSVSRQIEEIAAGSADLRKPDGSPVQAGATGAFHFGLGELLAQRRSEMERLLAKGGIVVVMGYPSVPHQIVGTLPGASRYTILPAPEGVAYRPPQLVPGDGTGVQALDPRHAFAGYLQDFGNRITYRARWETARIPDFASVGRVFGRSPGGADVALEFRLGPGRVIFLPPPTNDLKGAQRRPLTESLMEGIVRSFEAPPDEAAPGWVWQFTLPGVEESEERLQAAEQAFAEAEGDLVEARAFQADATKFQGLLWRDGLYGFEALVRDAMRTLGFDVEADLGRAAALSHLPDDADAPEVALLEIDASDKTVNERAYLGLQRRIEEEFLHSGHRRKGVIVVNGERRTAPQVRRAPYADTLANACANFGYALLTGETLFSLVTFALEEGDADTLAAIRETILTSDGLVSVEESDDAEDGAGDDAEDEAGEAPAAEAPAAEESDGPGVEESGESESEPVEVVAEAEAKPVAAEPVTSEADGGD